jgi:hypothetical protein
MVRDGKPNGAFCIVADGAHLRRAFQNGGSSIVHL